MFEEHYTRRRVLRRVGTASLATVPTLSGCLGSGESDTSETPASTTDTTSESQTSDPDSASDPNPDAWTEYAAKPYAQFSPHPDEIGSSMNHFTCTLPAVALQHSAAFGDAEGRFAANWIETPPGASPESTHFNIWTNSTRCIGGAFDKEPVVDRFESFSFEKLDPYKEFELYAGSTSGISLQVTAVRNGWLLITFPSDMPEGKQKVRHLIDLCLEDTTPYYRSTEPFTDLVEYLPQGVFTRVYPNVSELNPRLPRKQIEIAGEALLFDGQYEPVMGVIVLGFRDDIDDPRRVIEESSEHMTSFTRLSLRDHETEIRAPSNRILILEGPADPEAVFSA